MERGLLAVLSLLLAVSSIAGVDLSEQASDSIKLELVHRHWSKPFLEKGSIEKFFKNDFLRGHGVSHGIASRLGLPRRQTSENKASFPLSSAADDGISQYYVKLKLGNPVSEVTLIAASGTHLTWTDCSKLGRSMKTITCQPYQCGNDQLAYLFALQCQRATQACSFDAKFSGGLEAKGIFVNTTVSLSVGGGRQQATYIPLGCSSSVEGGSMLGMASGIMGLGVARNSIVDILDKAGWHVFSYCLMDHLSHKSISSYLAFSKYKSQNENMIYTELGLIDNMYAVQVRGISLWGKMLPIPSSAWVMNDGSPTTALDSGTSLTFLVSAAYDVVLKSMNKLNLKRAKNVYPMEFCVDVKGVNENQLPKMDIYLEGRGVFSPPTESYFIPVEENVRCLGIVRAPSDVSTFGSILQQSHLWEFDLHNGKVGVAKANCAHG